MMYEIQLRNKFCKQKDTKLGTLSEKKRDYVGKIPKLGGGV